MARPMGMEYELDLQKQPGAWSHVLTTKAWETGVEGPGGRPFGLATLSQSSVNSKLVRQVRGRYSWLKFGPLHGSALTPRVQVIVPGWRCKGSQGRTKPCRTQNIQQMQYGQLLNRTFGKIKGPTFTLRKKYNTHTQKRQTYICKLYK